MPTENSTENVKRRALGLVVRGLCMGTADVIPGVSGGTMALITGIYYEFVATLAAINTQVLTNLLRLRVGQVWTQLNGSFLVPLLVGIGIAVLSLAKLITYLLMTYPVPVWGGLTGLIAASAIVVGRRVGDWSPRLLMAVIAGIVVGYGISIAIPVKTGDELYKFLLSGSVASVAMILPGISGSFILLVLGKYQQVFTAIHERDLAIVSVFGTGFVIGILLFSRVLKRLLARFHAQTMAFMVGLMAGSLRRVWPFREAVGEGENGLKGDYYTCALPAELSADIVLTLGLMVAGAGLVIVIELLSHRKRDPSSPITPGSVSEAEGIQYEWDQGRLWATLVGYWFICMVGAAVVGSSAGQNREGGVIILLMLAFCGLCMHQHRGGWQLGYRIFFVPGAWVSHALCSIPALALAAGILTLGNRLQYADRFVAFVASLPAVIFAMRQCKLFVRPADTERR